MNIRRMKKVLKAIENSHKRGLFDMLSFGPLHGQAVKDCGTRGCIAAHAAWLFLTQRERKQLNARYKAFDIGAALLDLPLGVARQLFLPHGYSDYTYKAAKRALETLIQQKTAVGSYDGRIHLPTRTRA